MEGNSVSTRTVEIVATFRAERWRSPEGDFLIGSIQLDKSSKQLASEAGIRDVDGWICAKGNDSEPPLEKGMTYRFLGTWGEWKSEKQFQFRTYIPHVGQDPVSLANYLAAAGAGNGIGPSRAKRLVNAIGVDEVLEICRTQPHEVANISGISIENAESFAAVLRARQKTEQATIDLDKLLVRRGFPKDLPGKLIKAYGNRAAEVVTADPYLLMGYERVGFKKADKLYMELGKDPRSLDRMALCLWYGLHSDNSGHTWFPAKYAIEKLHSEIGGADVDFRGAILRGKEFAEESEYHYGAISTIRTDANGFPQEGGPSLWIAETKNDAAERSIVESLLEAERETESTYVSTYELDEETTTTTASHARCARCFRPLTAREVHLKGGKPYGPTCIDYIGGADSVVELSDWLEQNPNVSRKLIEFKSGWREVPSFSIWPEPDSIEGISDHQRAEYAKATAGRICCLIGGPGTGKTFVIAQTIKAMVRQGLCGLNDIIIGAPTGKAAVRMTESLNNAGINKRAKTWASLLWGLGEVGDKLPGRVIFGDETSMKDLLSFAAALRARSPGCHFMLVGDPGGEIDGKPYVGQLAPVGAGAPFRDVVAAGIPTGRLTEVRRNAGQIVLACDAIAFGRDWLEFCNQSEGNLFFDEVDNPEQQLNILETHLQDRELWDSQVVVALNDKGPLSRKEVNKRLQQLFNAGGQPIGKEFRIGDKVVCLKNSWFKSAAPSEEADANENGEYYVANGELGQIVDSHAKGFIVEIQSPRRSVIVPVRKELIGGHEDAKESGSGCDWDLGYALSVHKAQGSEFPHTFVLVDPAAKNVCDASWVKTAISRGKLTTRLIGQKLVAERFCRGLWLNDRKTFLRERIIDSKISMELAGL
jgi:ATP-dependent exoDNAse (exonuclease V) alpha subunit